MDGLTDADGTPEKVSFIERVEWLPQFWVYVLAPNVGHFKMYKVYDFEGVEWVNPTSAGPLVLLKHSV